MSFKLSESYCFIDETQHGGTPLSVIGSISSATHCQFECQKYAGCTYFSYNIVTGNCNLYSAANPTTSTAHTSGPKFCAMQISK